ncbi:MAG: pilus assembly protein [Devosia sp.]|nr:pilus assembly protein [Devosia sp.]
MKRRLRALLALLRRDERGTSALEFAIVAIPLMAFMFGILEFGRAIWIEEALQSTATTVARCMGLKLTGCASSGTYSATLTSAYAITVAQQWDVTLTTANISTTNATSCPGMTGSTSYALVTLTYPFSTVAASLVPALASKNVTGQACYPIDP